jgi:6-pyruvoyl-tetrahydropterin synthase
MSNAYVLGILETISTFFEHSYEYSTGHCGEFALAVSTCLEFLDIDNQLCIVFDYDNIAHHAATKVLGKYFDHRGLFNTLVEEDGDQIKECDYETFANLCQDFAFDEQMLIETLERISEVLSIDVLQNFDQTLAHKVLKYFV